MLSSLGKATAIKAANLEAISLEGDFGEVLDLDPYAMDLTEQQMDDLGCGETSIDDLGNPHLRRLASKFFKTGLNLEDPWLMENWMLALLQEKSSGTASRRTQKSNGSLLNSRGRNRFEFRPRAEGVRSTPLLRRPSMNLHLISSVRGARVNGAQPVSPISSLFQ